MFPIVRAGVATALLLCGLFLEPFFGLSSASANNCLSERDADALRAASIQQRLLVASSACREVSARYPRFVARYQSDLGAADAALDDFFNSHNAQTGAADFRLFKTKLATSALSRNSHDSKSFCAEADGILDHLLAAKTNFETFARTQAVEFDMPYVACAQATAATQTAGIESTLSSIPQPQTPSRPAVVSRAPTAALSPSAAKSEKGAQVALPAQVPQRVNRVAKVVPIEPSTATAVAGLNFVPSAVVVSGNTVRVADDWHLRSKFSAATTGAASRPTPAQEASAAPILPRFKPAHSVDATSDASSEADDIRAPKAHPFKPRAVREASATPLIVPRLKPAFEYLPLVTPARADEVTATRTRERHMAERAVVHTTESQVADGMAMTEPNFQAKRRPSRITPAFDPRVRLQPKPAPDETSLRDRPDRPQSHIDQQTYFAQSSRDGERVNEHVQIEKRVASNERVQPLPVPAARSHRVIVAETIESEQPGGRAAGKTTRVATAQAAAPKAPGGKAISVVRPDVRAADKAQVGLRVADESDAGTDDLGSLIDRLTKPTAVVPAAASTAPTVPLLQSPTLPHRGALDASRPVPVHPEAEAGPESHDNSRADDLRKPDFGAETRDASAGESQHASSREDDADDDRSDRAAAPRLRRREGPYEAQADEDPYADRWRPRRAWNDYWAPPPWYYPAFRNRDARESSRGNGQSEDPWYRYSPYDGSGY